jgi:hypothetical protein
VYLAMNLPVFGIVLMFCEYAQIREDLVDAAVNGKLVAASPW